MDVMEERSKCENRSGGRKEEGEEGKVKLTELRDVRPELEHSDSPPSTPPP